MAETTIEWTDRAWNFIRGCSLISPGCQRCYAMKTAHRFSGPGGTYEGLTELGPNGPRWNGKIRVVEDKIAEPLHVRTPQRWFVNSMSDLFHHDVPFEVIDKAVAVMALTPQHTYQILTKRPDRMLEYFTDSGLGLRIGAHLMQTARGHVGAEIATIDIAHKITFGGLPNVWLGVSVENQDAADKRIQLLLRTPAAVRFVSYEPALGAVDFTSIDLGQQCWLDATTGFARSYNAIGGMMRSKTPGYQKLDWIIVGGESGHGARPFNIAWARSVVQQCKAAGVACFVKQLGKNPYEAPEGITPNTCGPDAIKCRLYDLDIDKAHGGDMVQWPEDLRVRQFPEVRA